MMEFIQSIERSSFTSFLLFFLLTCQVLSLTNGVEPAKCYSVHEKIGECVSFEMCPPLKQLLQSGSLTVDKLRILQRLTCGFNKDEPKICCPLTEIVRSPGEIPGFQTNSQVKLKPEQGAVKLTSTAIPETAERIRTPQITNYKSHPHFKLIPGLRDCSNAVNSDRIVGGKDVGLAAYPWMARIGYRNEATKEVEFYCGGSVINNRYILSAAHCTEEIDEGFTPVIIRVGEHDTTTEEDCNPYLGCAKYRDYEIEKIIPHQRYSTDDKSNDIELIRVKEDISFEPFNVKPVCLPFFKEFNVLGIWQRISGSGVKQKGWVAGWGRTKWNQAEGSNTLQEVQLPLISNDECQFNYSTRVNITDKQMCAGGIKQKDSCGGDSGGPLLVPVTVVGDAKFFQLGVVSFGPVQCGVAGLPGVYSRVTAYLSWILDNIRS